MRTFFGTKRATAFSLSTCFLLAAIRRAPVFESFTVTPTMPAFLKVCLHPADARARHGQPAGRGGLDHEPGTAALEAARALDDHGAVLDLQADDLHADPAVLARVVDRHRVALVADAPGDAEQRMGALRDIDLEAAHRHVGDLPEGGGVAGAVLDDRASGAVRRRSRSGAPRAWAGARCDRRATRFPLSGVGSAGVVASAVPTLETGPHLSGSTL